MLDEFCCKAFRTTFYETVETLQAGVERWLLLYNNERPHQVYRNGGNRSLDTVNA